jgi:hypothetical protein
MAITSITEQGKAFIRSVCEGIGSSLLNGKNNEGSLPYCYPETSPSKVWYSQAKYNGTLIKTNQELGEALIVWFNKYGQQYQMDPNVIAAQAYAESGYKLWNYPLTSTASGINQFIATTVYSMIINNSNFTQAEKNALTVGWSGNTMDMDTFRVDKPLGSRNRPYGHQNICNNPEIMIKAQFVYLKYISDKYTKGITSSTLFGYSRGEGLCTPSYSTSIQKAAKYKSGYELEGVNYVLRIFNLLGKKPTQKGGNPHGYFGYDDLGMNLPFDSYKAEVDETNLRT